MKKLFALIAQFGSNIKAKLTPKDVPLPDPAPHKQKLRKILRGALVALAGVAVTYGGELLITGTLTALGPWGPIVSALASIGINAGRKWLEKNAEPTVI